MMRAVYPPEPPAPAEATVKLLDCIAKCMNSRGGAKPLFVEVDRDTMAELLSDYAARGGGIPPWEGGYPMFFGVRIKVVEGAS